MNIFLVFLSAFLFSLPWFGLTSVSLLLAFIPLLYLQKREGGKHFILYVISTVILWNLATEWWITKAAFIGIIAATLTHTVLVSLVMFIYNAVWKRASRALAYTVLVCGWIAFEYIYLNGEISFPWLVLGNGFAIDVKLIQWYEYTGTLGGTLWILISNLVIFHAIEQWLDLRKHSTKASYTLWIAPILILLFPMVISWSIYTTYEEKEAPVKVTILQPNIDPYTEKFSSMTPDQQLQLILDLSNQAPVDTRFLVAPETALDNRFWLDGLNSHYAVDAIRKLLRQKFPNVDFIGGITLYQLYSDCKTPPTSTARKTRDGAFFYDVYNSAIQINTTDSVSLYHKSKLVIGVEMLPYHEYLGFIRKLSVDLGGISGMMATQPERSVFESNQRDVSVGSAICYESVYGEFFSEFVQKGAQLMFVITNDGWWGDTFGYHQHFVYSRLRAIETRRSIARSANTGISAFINQRGDIVESLGWGIRGTLSKSINKNDELTFYVRYGDMIGRISCYVFLLSLLYFGAYMRRKKDYLYHN